MSITHKFRSAVATIGTALFRLDAASLATYCPLQTIEPTSAPKAGAVPRV
jgi:hypothetical protein